MVDNKVNVLMSKRKAVIQCGASWDICVVPLRGTNEKQA